MPLVAIRKARSRPTAAIAIRPLAQDAHRRVGLVWRESYAKAGDLRLLAEVIQANLPASVRPIAARAA